MSAHKNLLHEAVTTWLIVEGLEDTPENYEAGVSAVMDAESVSPVAHVDGGGGAQCSDCKGMLTYSWRVTLENGTALNLCSECLTVRSPAGAQS